MLLVTALQLTSQLLLELTLQLTLHSILTLKMEVLKEVEMAL